MRYNFQLYMARTQLESLISERSCGGKKVLRKELDTKTIEKIAVFLRSLIFSENLFKNFNLDKMLIFQENRKAIFSNVYFF